MARALARQHRLHELRARHFAEQADPRFGFFAQHLAQRRAFTLAVKQRQVHVFVAVDAVEQTQHPHFARLVPQRQRAVHAQQMVLEGAGLVPVFAGAAREQQVQQCGQVGIDGGVVVGKQRARVRVEFVGGGHGARRVIESSRYCVRMRRACHGAALYTIWLISI
ncbi:hypothetical protein D3C71_1535350 [compost metagenome]